VLCTFLVVALDLATTKVPAITAHGSCSQVQSGAVPDAVVRAEATYRSETAHRARRGARDPLRDSRLTRSAPTADRFVLDDAVQRAVRTTARDVGEEDVRRRSRVPFAIERAVGADVAREPAVTGCRIDARGTRLVAGRTASFAPSDPTRCSTAAARSSSRATITATVCLSSGSTCRREQQSKSETKRDAKVHGKLPTAPMPHGAAHVTVTCPS